jgi:hypothetical protein
VSALACCLYIALGSAYMLPNPTPQSYGFEFWRYDRTQIANPYGVIELGFEYPVTHSLELEIAGRHISSLGVDWHYGWDEQWGENTAELRLRWYPFR